MSQCRILFAPIAWLGITLNLGNAATGINTGDVSTRSNTRSTSNLSPSGIPNGRNFGFFNCAAAASYTVDFWGVNEDASFASRLLANASRFDRDVVEISTVTAVMNAYFQVLNAQDQLQIARTNVAIAEKLMQRSRVAIPSAQPVCLIQRSKKQCSLNNARPSRHLR